MGECGIWKADPTGIYSCGCASLQGRLYPSLRSSLGRPAVLRRALGHDAGFTVDGLEDQVALLGDEGPANDGLGLVLEGVGLHAGVPDEDCLALALQLESAMRLLLADFLLDGARL